MREFWRNEGKQLSVTKINDFAINFFAIAAEKVGFFGAAFLGLTGNLLLAIPSNLRYHLPARASARIAKWQKRILWKANDIGAHRVVFFPWP